MRIVAFVVAGWTALALAQSADPLPARLSGRWTFVGAGGVTSDTVVLTFDPNAPAGTAVGTVSFRGVTCGAQNEPFTGTWNGTELRFDATHRANVNTQRPDGQCGAGRVAYLLTRKPGDKMFVGEARMDGEAAAATLSLAP